MRVWVHYLGSDWTCVLWFCQNQTETAEKVCLQKRATPNRTDKQVLRHKKVLTDLYVSCVGPSTFNGQDEYAERELETMGNDLHNNSHYDHNKSPSPFWIIMLPYCCLLHLFFPLYHSDPQLKIPLNKIKGTPILKLAMVKKLQVKKLIKKFIKYS